MITKDEFKKMNLPDFKNASKLDDFIIQCSVSEQIEIVWERLTIDQQRTLIRLVKNYTSNPFSRPFNLRKYHNLFPEFGYIRGSVKPEMRDYIFRQMLNVYDDPSLWF